MVILGLDRVSTSTKESIMAFIASRIETNIAVREAQSRRFLLTSDENARAAALDAMGREDAYKDMYFMFNDNNPWVEK